MWEDAMSKQRSRRLRKKLHVGEFKQMGFAFEATLHPSANDDALIDALLGEVIAPMNLSFGGWATRGMVCHSDWRSVSADERRAVLDWVKARPEVISVQATELYDMWYDTETDKALKPWI
jgi:hypothetical protein